MIKKKYFGTDGLRGRVGSALINPEFMLKLGFAVGAILRKQSDKKITVLIGRDTRASGEILESALAKGLMHSGINVKLLGVLPTPAIAYFTKKLNAQAGVVISASHNPAQDNGVKFIDAFGMKLPDDWELAVENKMATDLSPLPENQQDSVTPFFDAADLYVKHCVDLFKTSCDLTGFKVVLDCANGATHEVAPKIFSALGAKVIAVHDEPNGENINDGCGATDVASLQKQVLKAQADCGLAFDGDGDRLMMVDHKGERVDGDEMLGLLACHQNACAGVVGTLMSNLGLEKALKKNNIQFERAAVGDRYVLERMKEKGWQLGGEASGHLINLAYSTTGDGIVTGLQVLACMQQTKKSLYALKQVVKKRPQILINVPVENPARYSEMDDISDAVRQTEKTLGDSGRVLLRASGTESCVRVMVECDVEKQSVQLAESLAETVQRCFTNVQQTI